jgi:homoserine kinase type II
MIAHHLIKSDFQAVLDQFQIGKFVSHRFIDTTVENLNYAIKTTKGKFLLKVFESRDLKHLKFQNDIIHYLQTQKIKIAPLVFANNGSDLIQYGDRYISIFKFIEGTHPKTLSPNLCVAIAKEVARLHQALLQKTVKGKSISSYYAPEDKALFIGKKLRKSVIHGDLGKPNILVKNNKVAAIIDFSDAGYNYLVSDLAIFIAGAFLEKDAVKYYPRFIEAYTKIVPLTKDEEKLLPVFVGIRIRNVIAYLKGVIEEKQYKPRQFKHILKGLRAFQNKQVLLGKLFPRSGE